MHFTGSTGVFNSMWQRVGENIGSYRGYPRLVGETGGKDFIVAHASADPQEVAVAVVRGAFEYPGAEVLGRQPGLRAAARCGTTSATAWSAMMQEIAWATSRDFRNFMGAVIDQKAFTKISGYIEDAKKNARDACRAAAATASEGYFIEPTLVETVRPGLPPAVRGDLRAGPHRVTPTTMRSGARRWRWWTGRRRMR